MPDEIEDRIESIILNNSEEISLPIGDKLGREIAVETAVDDYVEYIKSTVDGDFKTLKIALDCANGAAFKAAPKALRELGAEVFVLNERPDGININKNCGSTHMEELKEFVKRPVRMQVLPLTGMQTGFLQLMKKATLWTGIK